MKVVVLLAEHHRWHKGVYSDRPMVKLCIIHILLCPQSLVPAGNRQPLIGNLDPLKVSAFVMARLTFFFF